MKWFNEGDFVWVVMARNDCFGFQKSPRFVAKILHRPQDTGDIWYFTRFGMDIAINPMSADFIGLVAIKKEDKHVHTSG